jgi:hypothetical protein
VSNIGTGSITPTLQVKDSVSGNYKTIWTAAAAITANGDYVYYFADGIPATQPASMAFTEVIPYGLPSRTWRLNVVANNANSVSYSASGTTGV